MKKNKTYANNVIFLKVRLNEAENKYKDIQDKLEKISEETNARAPECMALKADVTAKKRAYHEAEVREIVQSGILKTVSNMSNINTLRLFLEVEVL